jgi:hypothetical protein
MEVIMADFILLDEDFSDFPIGEFPYDKNHSAMGEYHFIHYPGYYGKWYDPVCNHTYNGQGASWIISEYNGKHFMDGDCYRESCYQCVYANTSRVGDITVGDFWGIAKSHPEFNSPKGVSSVFVNTEKGQELFEKMKPFAETEQATLKEAMVKQGNLVQPSNRPENRSNFYREIDEPDFVSNLKVGLQLKARIKTILPSKLIQKIKSL